MTPPSSAVGDDLSGQPDLVELSLTLCLPRDAVSVPLSRRVTQQLLSSIGFLREDVADIELALTEACSNVLRHSGSGDEYEVRLAITGDTVMVDVCHRGTTVPAEVLARQSVADDAESGRGIPLMRALVDKLSFEDVPGDGAMVRMTRQLRAEPGSAMAEALLGGAAR